MHISEGVLDARWCLVGYAAATPLVAYGLKKLDHEEIPRVCVMGAAFFVASLVHLKLPLASVHLTLIGLTGVILGPPAVLAIATGLFFQAVMFQHGGLTTLGLNTFAMGTAALICQAAFIPARRLSGRRHRPRLALAGGILSGLGVLLAALLVSLTLYLATPDFAGVAMVFSVANMVVAGVEAIVSCFIIDQILRVKPELLHGY